MSIDSSKTQKFRGKMRELYDDANEWRAHWKEISDYMIPQKGRFLMSPSEKQNRGNKVNSRIINGTAKKALRTLAAGMQGGLTSPARP